MGLGALDLGGGDIEGETGPFAQSEVNKVIKTGDLVRDEVDSPKTVFVST